MKRSPVKSVDTLLKTIPDGAAVLVLFVGGGIVTTKGTFLLLTGVFTIFPVPS